MIQNDEESGVNTLLSISNVLLAWLLGAFPEILSATDRLED